LAKPLLGRFDPLKRGWEILIFSDSLSIGYGRISLKLLSGALLLCGEGQSGQTSHPFLGQEPKGSKRHFSHSIASDTNTTLMNVAFGANWIQLEPDRLWKQTDGATRLGRKRSLSRLAID
jgi:hypothetical protein